MLRSYKYRVYPSKQQKTLLSKHFGCARWIWNWGLAKKIEHYQKTAKTIGRYELSPMLPLLKLHEETEWLKEVNAQSLQQVLVNLDMAYGAFFKKNANFPNFKSKRNRQSVRFPQHFHIDIEDRYIRVPRVGKISVVLDRTFDGIAKSITISRDPSGKFYASVLVETGKENEQENYDSNSTVGIDLGLTHFATLSTGEKIDNPRFLKASQKKLAREQQRMDRKNKGSKNRNKQRIRVALAHEKVRNQRKDFLHKLSTKLIRENQAVAIEDLNLEGMLKNRCLSMAISDVGWGTFISMLGYKAVWYGKTVIKIGRFDPSSKLCTCGIINRTLTLKDRIWTCQSCGHHSRP